MLGFRVRVRVRVPGVIRNCAGGVCGEHEPPNSEPPKGHMPQHSCGGRATAVLRRGGLSEAVAVCDTNSSPEAFVVE
jgi:hypothetical protein